MINNLLFSRNVIKNYVIGQRLEDIDISVHCEIPIFDWLIKWVKKDLKPKNEWPLLGAKIYFLK